MSKPKATTQTKNAPRRMLVVYGFDDDKKPRAAKFAEPEFELARKAAELMNLQMHEGEARKLRRILRNIPLGKIYVSGWGSVPNIRRSQFDALVAKLSSIKYETTDAVVHTGLPVSWDLIGIGHLVLGQADSAADGWWPTTVEGVDGAMLVLQARDFPKAPRVVRHCSAVALLYSADFVAPDHDDSVAPGLPVSWDDLALDDLVIAQEENAELGWWEAVIVEIDKDELTLRWRDFPRQPHVKRHRHAVALLDPTSPSKP